MNLKENTLGFKITANPPQRHSSAAGSSSRLFDLPYRRSSIVTSDREWGNSSMIHRTLRSDLSKESSADLTHSRAIIALTEGRGNARGEVGLAFLQISRNRLRLCQISDTQGYINILTKINILDPNEILVPNTFLGRPMGNGLIDEIRRHFPKCKITGVARSAFSKDLGSEKIQKFCKDEQKSILLALQHRYYALGAAAALLGYAEETYHVFYKTDMLEVEYEESEGHAVIDITTADIMELVSSTKPNQSNKNSSLYDILNHCHTQIGSRLLRSSILQPLFNSTFINERLDNVEYLKKRPEMLTSVKSILQKVPNIEHLLSITTITTGFENNFSNRNLNYILLIKEVLDIVQPLRDLIEDETPQFFTNLKDILSSNDFNTLKDYLKNVIHENAHQSKGHAAVMQRCFAVKSGVNELLDLVRKAYSERIEDMNDYVRMLGEKYGFSLVLANNSSKGYHISLKLNQQQKRFLKQTDLPKEFVETTKLAGSFTFKTQELINISTRLDSIIRDILHISNLIVNTIINKLKQFVPLFIKLVDNIALLDLLQSLAESGKGPNYTRPKFGPFTEVSYAHHPLLEHILPSRPESNPISCSEKYNLHIITGPNGSGKSIYIRQVLLLQVLAQIGCYIPAKKAMFRPADKMFARMYFEDNMECGASSFILEMSEMKFILNSATKNSLIIIDELCRSTCFEEGTALAMAICEKLASLKAFVFLTTHYTLITQLCQIYNNIKVWQMETIETAIEDQRKLEYNYNLISGVCCIQRYGLSLVENLWSEIIIKDIKEVLSFLENESRQRSVLAEETLPFLEPEVILKENSFLNEFPDDKIKEELEICSKLFLSQLDDENMFGEDMPSPVLQPSENEEYVEPVVTVFEGPNIPSVSSLEEEPNDNNDNKKIIIHSNILLNNVLQESTNIASTCYDVTNKSNTFQTTTSSDLISKEDSSKKSSETNIKIKRKRFKPPKKLTKREIIKDFKKQDQEFFDNNYFDKTTMDNYVTNLLNRPSVDQLTSARRFVFNKITRRCIEVKSPKKKKPKLQQKPKSSFNKTFDSTILTDKKANETFLNTTRKSCIFSRTKSEIFKCDLETNKSNTQKKMVLQIRAASETTINCNGVGSRRFFERKQKAVFSRSIFESASDYDDNFDL